MPGRDVMGRRGWPGADKAAQKVAGGTATVRVSEKINEETRTKVGEVIGDVLQDWTMNPEELMSNAEMAAFVLSRERGSFDLMGDVDFAKAYASGNAIRRTTYRYVAWLRIRMLEALRAEDLIDPEAYEFKYHWSLYWYNRLRDAFQGNAGTREQGHTWLHWTAGLSAEDIVEPESQLRFRRLAVVQYMRHEVPRNWPSARSLCDFAVPLERFTLNVAE